MFSKFCKPSVRRVLPGTCLVAGGTGVAKVSLSLQLVGGCWGTTSRKVAMFSFLEASGHAPSQALLDLEHLFRCTSKPSAGVMQVKICVALRGGGKRVARADLGEFLGQLLRGGRLDSFLLYIHEDRVALLQATPPAPYPATEWLFEGQPQAAHTNTCEGAKADVETCDIDDLQDQYKGWKEYLEEVFSVDDEFDKMKASKEKAYREWKTCLEEVFSVDDEFDKMEESREKEYREWKTHLEDVVSVPHEAVNEATPELREASDPGSEAAHEATSEVKEVAQSGAVAAAKEVPHEGEASAPASVSATPSTTAFAYRSLVVAHRFIHRLAGPGDRHLEDLRRWYGVQITRVKRTLHVKGRRDAVVRCHNHMRATIAEWRSSEASDAH